jgi:lysophospholipase L1-like esterase
VRDADDGLLAPLNIINRGFGGSQIEDVNSYFNTVVTPYKPRRIVFYAGDNDISAGKSTAQVVADFEKFMALKTAALGQTPVYFISVKPSKLRLAQLPQQNEVNAKVKAMADARADLVYIDVVAPMMDGNNPREIFVADGLHMTQEGYIIWTKAVRPVLTAKAPTRAPGCPR